MRGLVTAVRTLTIFPCPGKDADRFSASLPWFPAVGLMLGGMLWLTAYAADAAFQNQWHNGTALGLLIMTIIMTRALHLDGLSDCADGFWGGHDRDKILSIMKDSSIGTFGAAALIIILLGKYICFARLLASGTIQWIPAAYIISRTMQVVLAASFPYARDNGGTAESFVADANTGHKATAILVCAALLLIIGRMDLMLIIAFVCALAVTILIGTGSQKKIKGITGDVLGATSELTELLVLFLGAWKG
ncbi:adenosylcobinamide-GDP ribazoletransferase [bacterium E08(2017)]|nr:adenosylcobinamide-GDP ribazoletransferase [bacterium E08(2017)]